jgi:hypothetical protein
VLEQLDRAVAVVVAAAVPVPADRGEAQAEVDVREILEGERAGGARQREAEALVVVLADPGGADLDAGVVAAVGTQEPCMKLRRCRGPDAVVALANWKPAVGVTASVPMRLSSARSKKNPRRSPV